MSHRTAIRRIMRDLCDSARYAARQARQYPHTRDYWRGQASAYLESARRLGHTYFGHHFLKARDRARFRQYSTRA